MTNKEYIQSIVSRFGASQTEVNILFAENNELNPDAEVNVSACKNALYGSFCSWVPMYESRSEGDMTVKWNWNAVKSFAASLSKELGKENPFDTEKPSVTAIDIWV